MALRYQARNTTASFAFEMGVGVPSPVFDWQVKTSLGAVLGTDAAPNGWNASYVWATGQMSLTVPAGAPTNPYTTVGDYVSAISPLYVTAKDASVGFYGAHFNTIIREVCHAEWTVFPTKYGNTLTIYVARPTGGAGFPQPVDPGSYAPGIWTTPWTVKCEAVADSIDKVWSTLTTAYGVRFASNGLLSLDVPGTGGNLQLSFNALHALSVACANDCPLGIYDGIEVELYTPSSNSPVENSPFSATLKVVVYDAALTYPPDNVDADEILDAPPDLEWPGECEGTQATLSWGAVEEADGYRVYFDGRIVWMGTETTAILSGLEIGRSYVFTVRAFNVGGESEDSLPVTVTPCKVAGCGCTGWKGVARPITTWRKPPC